MNAAPRRSRTLLAATFVVAVLGACALHTRAIYVEYYADGPPYYGRTTNMDKWESPLADLVLSNGLGLALALGVVYGIGRRARAR